MLVPFKDDNPKSTENTDFQAGSDSTPMAKDAGLIDVIRQGHCKPSKILVKTVMPVIDYEKHRLKVCESED